VNHHTQTVTVAIADTDSDRRTGYERFLQDEHGITLLRNVTSGKEVGHSNEYLDRRAKPRTDISASEDEVARIKRLKPLVLLVNLNLCTDEDYALLLSLRRECPEVLMVLLADDSVEENKIIQALEIGARGYLKYETVQHHLSRAIQAVGHGEVWLPRKMMGNIMDYILN
jgi:DNA-binding NarL/FixJ family response regulator